MAPLDQRLEAELLSIPPSNTKECNVEKPKPKLLFGCLDVFQFWKPTSSDNKSDGNDNRSTTSSVLTEISDDEPQFAEVTQGPLLDEDKNNSSRSIVLQSIVSYPSSEVGMAGTPANLDTYLTSKNSQDSRCNALQDNDQSSELSFSYSSFSETEDKNDNASTGDSSSVSFDPNDFLEDDQEELIREEKATKTKKLGTIMEGCEEYSSRTLRSARRQRSRLL